MKELRFTLRDGEWRIAFAFDPERCAILLIGGSKSGTSEKRFYKDLIRVADERFTNHLKTLRSKDGGKDMTITIKEFTKDFTRKERAKMAARTAELIEEELTLRDLRQAEQLTQERMAELMGVEQEMCRAWSAGRSPAFDPKQLRCRNGWKAAADCRNSRTVSPLLSPLPILLRRTAKPRREDVGQRDRQRLHRKQRPSVHRPSIDCI